MGDHDSLFKRAFSVPAHAAGELRSVLPAAAVERLDLDSLELVPASFVDPEMAHRHADLLFRAPLRESRRPVLVYFLLEHQSEPDPIMPFRAYAYADRVWSAVLRDEPDRRSLPPLLAIVVHHGRGGWTAPRSLHQMMNGLDEAPDLAPFVPNLELVIDDLATVDDETLAARPLAPLPKLTMFLLRDARDFDAFLSHLGTWARELEQLFSDRVRSEDAQVVLRYILRVTELSPEDLRQRIIEVAPTIEEPMASTEEQLIQRGIERGIERGRALGMEEGRVRALRDTLTRLLRARFGALDPAAETKIATAPEAELDRFLERVVTATSIDEVLGG